MKVVCALLLLLAFVFGVNAQASSSVTATSAPTPSTSNSFTNSGSPSGPASVSPSLPPSLSSSNSLTRTPSLAPSRSNSVSNTNSWTSSNSGSNTVTPPPAPTTPTNGCPNHIINICPVWNPPAGVVFAHYNLYFRVTGSTAAPTVFQVSGNSVRITNLTPSTSYDFAVEGVLANGVRSILSGTATFVTAAPDPKRDKARDISNIVCNNVKSSTTNRSVIQCSWTAAQDTILELRVKASCVSEIREPNEVRKKLFGTRAQATSITLNMNRDVATCEVFIKARYARRLASRHHLTVVMGQ